MKKYRVAIVGATGAVGREMLRCVIEFNFPFESIKLLASARSAGKEISFGAKRCPGCESKRRRTEISPAQREKLKYEIRNYSFLEVGRIYGVSDNAIRKMCDKCGLPRKKTDIKKYTDEEWEQI